MVVVEESMWQSLLKLIFIVLNCLNQLGNIFKSTKFQNVRFTVDENG